MRRPQRSGTGTRGAAPARRLLLALMLLAGTPALAQRLPADETLIAGFEAVVFGAEIRGAFSDTSYLKKFAGPVLFEIRNLAAIDRSGAVEGFVRQIDRQIEGLDARLAQGGERANFTVHVVDRADYARVGREIYRNPFYGVPGNCIVRTVFGRRGITRSDALIVSDEGDARFRRCLVEEILQGLGPLNENDAAPQSVFNDTSRITNFTPFDRVLLNMLYDPRLRPGLSQAEAEPLLPAVLGDARRRARGR